MKKINFLFLFLALTSLSFSYAKDNRSNYSAEYSTKLEHLNDTNFANKIGQGFSVVDFYADWCAPCRRLGPTFSKVANDLQGKLSFYKINIDDAPTTKRTSNVKSIPTIILFSNGREVARLSGEVDENTLKQFIFNGMK